MQIAQAIKQAEKQLSHIESAKLDTEILLSHCLQCDRSHLFAYPEEELLPECIEQFNEIIDKRTNGQPIAHLIGYREFWSLKLKVTPDTLIPRPETECLVEQALKKINPTDNITLLDLGTGTGAIAIALASERPAITITATDKSEMALAVAKENAETYQANINFIQADWLAFDTNMKFNIILSNPPYIDESDPCLHQGDVRFESKSALIAEDHGLADIRTIIEQSKNVLEKNGWLMLEHGYQQGQAVRDLFMNNMYEQIETHHDYAGHERITSGQLK